MFNYVQKQDISFIGINIHVSRNRHGGGCAFPGKTPARWQPDRSQLSTQESYLYLWPVDFQSKMIN